MFDEYADAEHFAVRLVKKQLLEKANRQGAAGKPKVEVNVRKIRNDAVGAGIFFESIVEAVATDKFRI